MSDLEKGEKDISAASPAVEPQVVQPAVESQPASPAAGNPSMDGGVTAGGKTYTEAELTEIMHERTKNFAAIKRQHDAYSALGSVDEIQSKLKGGSPQPAVVPETPMDEDEKKFVAYLKKVIPGLSKLEQLGGLDEDKIAFLNEMRERQQADKQDYVGKSEEAVFTHCETLGIKDEAQRVMVRDMVAVAIMNSPEISAKWAKNDPSAVTDALKIVSTLAGPKADPKVQIAAQQVVAAAKAKATLVKPPLPPGGVGAPITQERKLTAEERLDAAFKAVSNKVN